MRRFFVLVSSLALLVLTIGGAPATAHVHAVSQAGCAQDDAPAGGRGSAHAIDNGRPAAPIPVTASEGKTQSRGGEAPAEGMSC